MSVSEAAVASLPLRWQGVASGLPLPMNNGPWWMRGYAALPFADVAAGPALPRVYFSGRDAANRAHVGACTLDLATLRVVPGSLTTEPLVAPGPPGSFDESGCTMACTVRHGGLVHLFYTGWRLGSTVPFYYRIGLAVSADDGRTFTKMPMLGPAPPDPAAPVLNASPSVLVEGGGWRMWYVAGTRWERVGGGWRHFYLIRNAESHDGFVWRDSGVAIPLRGSDEHALGRPSVVVADGAYHMWYCHRGPAYRIGYAVSADGLQWQRRDGEAAAPQAADWDAEMQAYPAILRHGDRWVMLYNGNGYGATGFGVAVAERA